MSTHSTLQPTVQPTPHLTASPTVHVHSPAVGREEQHVILDLHHVIILVRQMLEPLPSFPFPPPVHVSTAKTIQSCNATKARPRSPPSTQVPQALSPHSARKPRLILVLLLFLLPHLILLAVTVVTVTVTTTTTTATAAAIVFVHVSLSFSVSFSVAAVTVTITVAVAVTFLVAVAFAVAIAVAVTVAFTIILIATVHVSVKVRVILAKAILVKSSFDRIQQDGCRLLLKHLHHVLPRRIRRKLRRLRKLRG
ncbi:unnamed protein product [Closterium sp. NIES-65]|nr:unnamed protein product [Closterium sp. NIES-65]